MGDLAAAKAYAVKAKELYTMVDSCVEDQTPWPFPGLKKFLHRWQATEVPRASKMAWYPDPELMRAKTTEGSHSPYSPCVPLRDPECFPPGSTSEYTSCSVCCDPK